MGVISTMTIAFARFQSRRSFLQIIGDCGKLLQSGFKVVHNFLRNDFWRGEVGAVFQRVVFEPEDVEVLLSRLIIAAADESTSPNNIPRRLQS